jgi:hypothetical protein
MTRKKRKLLAQEYQLAQRADICSVWLADRKYTGHGPAVTSTPAVERNLVNDPYWESV